ncbi:MAG: prepilin-type N-terminal cleavage/methylation domain-containing protein [Armatimonadetes bacterium]|nr:MAG: prepilin-type N-terminal cleavage/methylation domain-containing protein [Armatimonadota bacterium]
MRRRGLTLIELLSVLTIVAVLAALLYPVFKSVRMRALDAGTECVLDTSVLLSGLIPARRR